MNDDRLEFGPGWREVGETEFLRFRVEAVTFWRDGAGTRFWIRDVGPSDAEA